jgi:hypothetical protein
MPPGENRSCYLKLAGFVVFTNKKLNLLFAVISVVRVFFFSCLFVGAASATQGTKPSNSAHCAPEGAPTSNF